MARSHDPERERLAALLAEILRLHHEAASTLSAALLGADALVELLRSPGGAHAALEIAAELRTSLVRLKSLLDETRELSRREAGFDVAVAVLPVARDVVDALTDRHPELRFACSASSLLAESALARLPGGDGALRRLLEALLSAASDGARTVSVRLDVLQDGDVIAVRIATDAPGRLAGLGTSLAWNAAERIVRASGGSLHAEPPADGGATLALHLTRFAERDR